MFVIVGLIGAGLLLSTFLFDDWLDELVPGFDVLSGPVIGAFMAAFGLFGWFAERELHVGQLGSVAVGVGGGVAMGYATYRGWKVLAHQATDGTPTMKSAEGKTGRVVTPVPAGGIGEGLIEVAGSPVKYSIISDEPLTVGDRIVVVEALSATRLRVQSEETFWK